TNRVHRRAVRRAHGIGDGIEGPEVEGSGVQQHPAFAFIVHGGILPHRPAKRPEFDAGQGRRFERVRMSAAVHATRAARVGQPMTGIAELSAGMSPVTHTNRMMVDRVAAGASHHTRSRNRPLSKTRRFRASPWRAPARPTPNPRTARLTIARNGTAASHWDWRNASASGPTNVPAGKSRLAPRSSRVR